MGQLTIVFAASLGLVLVLTLYRRIVVSPARSNTIRQNGCQPPAKYPHRDPFLGLDLFMNMVKSMRKGCFLSSVQQRHQAYGNTFQTEMFGRTIINTIEPRNFQAILSASDGSSFGVEPIRGPPSALFLGTGVFTSDGAPWAHARSLMRPSLTKSHVANLDLLEVHVSRLLGAIPTDGSTFDLQLLFGQLFLDSSTEFLFGESVNSQATSTLDAVSFLESFDYAKAGLAQRFRMGKLRHLVRDPKYVEACQQVHTFVDHYVAKALKHEEARKASAVDQDATERYVLLNEMAKGSSDAVSLRYQILNVFLAGYGSTAVAVSNLFFHLARHPAEYQKLRAEVLALGSTPLTYESLKSLKLLRHAFAESNRLNPLGPLLTRTCLRDTVLPCGGGAAGTSPLLVKKGQNLALCLFAMHRRTDIWGDDANTFRPERFEKRELPSTWEFLPFGGGSRSCPAQQLAVTESAYMIVRICQAFEKLESRDPEEWVEQMGMTLTSRNGVKVAVKVAEE